MLHRQRSAFDLNDLSESSPHASRHRNVNLTVRDLVIFALHIDSAMEYVATMKVRLLGNIYFESQVHKNGLTNMAYSLKI